MPKKIRNFHPDVVEKFRQPKAASFFLVPLGISLKDPIPEEFSTNIKTLGRTEETQFFEALLFVKYWMDRIDDESRKNKLSQVYVAIRNRIICANIGLIHECMRLKSYITDRDDMMSAGHIALMDAVEKFDPYRGFRFSTYAMTCIFRRISKDNRRKHISLIEDMGTLNPEYKDNNCEDKDAHAFLANMLRESMKILPEEDIQILTLRYNLGDVLDKRMTLEQVSEIRGKSKERIRQIQERALTRLKEYLERREEKNQGIVHQKNS